MSSSHVVLDDLKLYRRGRTREYVCGTCATTRERFTGMAWSDAGRGDKSLGKLSTVTVDDAVDIYTRTGEIPRCCMCGKGAAKESGPPSDHPGSARPILGVVGDAGEAREDRERYERAKAKAKKKVRVRRAVRLVPAKPKRRARAVTWAPAPPSRVPLSKWGADGGGGKRKGRGKGKVGGRGKSGGKGGGRHAGR